MKKYSFIGGFFNRFNDYWEVVYFLGHLLDSVNRKIS